MMQRSTMTCDDCGALVIICATANVRQFDYACTRCTNRGVISWATSLEAPTFESSASAQLTLFEAAS